MASSESVHYAFPHLADELNRINRPKRYLLTAWTCTGLAVGAYAGTLAFLRFQTVQTLSWWLGELAFAILIPATSVVTLWALTTFPPSPVGITISQDGVELDTPGRSSSGFRWSELNHSLTIYDERPLGPTWENGSPRTIDYVLLSFRLRLRSPLTSEAFSALVQAAEKHNFKVDGLSDSLDRGSQVGPPGLVRLLPPGFTLGNPPADPS